MSLQFGFKVRHSTSMCTMIEHYCHNNNTVHCVMLNATTAFDRVGYCQLIRLLLNKKMLAVIIGILPNMYYIILPRLRGTVVIPTVFK